VAIHSHSCIIPI